MEIKVSKWGNSMALRLPKSVIKDLNIADGSLLEVRIQENQLIAKPIKKKYSLKELLQKVNESNLHAETSTGGL